MKKEELPKEFEGNITEDLSFVFRFYCIAFTVGLLAFAIIGNFEKIEKFIYQFINY